MISNQIGKTTTLHQSQFGKGPLTEVLQKTKPSIEVAEQRRKYLEESAMHSRLASLHQEFVRVIEASTYRGYAQANACDHGNCSLLTVLSDLETLYGICKNAAL